MCRSRRVIHRHTPLPVYSEEISSHPRFQVILPKFLSVARAIHEKGPNNCGSGDILMSQRRLLSSLYYYFPSSFPQTKITVIWKDQTLPEVTIPFSRWGGMLHLQGKLIKTSWRLFKESLQKEAGHCYCNDKNRRGSWLKSQRLSGICLFGHLSQFRAEMVKTAVCLLQEGAHSTTVLFSRGSACRKRSPSTLLRESNFPM